MASITALAVTGGVITSAAILLAAVFAVLRVLALITLPELGIIVWFGSCWTPFWSARSSCLS